MDIITNLRAVLLVVQFVFDFFGGKNKDLYESGNDSCSWIDNLSSCWKKFKLDQESNPIFAMTECNALFMELIKLTEEQAIVSS